MFSGLLLAAALLGASAADPAASLLDALNAAPELSVFAGLLDDIDPYLKTALADDSAVHTLFAPSNAAMLGAGAADLPADELSSRMSYGLVLSDKSTHGEEIPFTCENLLNANLTAYDPVQAAHVPLYGWTVESFVPHVCFLNSANVTADALATTAGGSVLSVVDELLTPPTGSVLDLVSSLPELGEMYAALQNSGPDVLALMGDESTLLTAFVTDNGAVNAFAAGSMIDASADLVFGHMMVTGWTSTPWPQMDSNVVFEQQLFSFDYATQTWEGPATMAADFESLALPSAEGILTATRVGGEAFVTDSHGTLANISHTVVCTNGVAHFTGAVLYPPQNVMELLETPIEPLSDAGNYTQFLALVGLDQELNDTLTLQPEALTVLAPTDAAFAALPAGFLDGLSLEYKQRMARYHVVQGAELDCEPNSFSHARSACDFFAGETLAALSGDPLFVSTPDVPAFWDESSGEHQWDVYINGADMVETDTVAVGQTAGVVHPLEHVLLPPSGSIFETLAADDRFTAVVGFIEQAGLVDVFNSTGLAPPGTGPANETGPAFTFFAPTDDAVEASLPDYVTADAGLLEQALLYALVPGDMFSGVFNPALLTPVTSALSYNNLPLAFSGTQSGFELSVNLASATELDVTATNGVVHVLDAALVPDLLQLSFAKGLTNLTDLVLADAALYEQFTSAAPAPRTLFAPTNEAFDTALGEDWLYNVSLGDALDYSTTDDGAFASVAALADGQRLGTLLGGNETLVTFNGLLSLNLSDCYVNNAQLEFNASVGVNGAVFAASALLRPPTLSAEQVIAGDPDLSVFWAAMQSAGLSPGATTFAVENDAWSYVPGLDAVLASGQMPNLLRYHMADDVLYTARFAPPGGVDPSAPYTDGAVLPTSLGDAYEVAFQVVDASYMFVAATGERFNAQIVDADLSTKDGKVVHKIAGILTYDGYSRPGNAAPGRLGWSWACAAVVGVVGRLLM